MGEIEEEDRRLIFKDFRYLTSKDYDMIFSIQRVTRPDSIELWKKLYVLNSAVSSDIRHRWMTPASMI